MCFKKTWMRNNLRTEARNSGRRILVFWSGRFQKWPLIDDQPNYCFYCSPLSFLTACFLSLLYRHHISTAFSDLLKLSVSILSITLPHLSPPPVAVSTSYRLLVAPSGMTQTWPPPPPHLLSPNFLSQ
jgi:hypothetical protein